MSGSRVAYQLAKQNTLPCSRALCKLNGNQVPANSIILIGLLACIYSISGQFDMLTNLAVFSCWIFYTPVSYTHLDVYKRQPLHSAAFDFDSSILLSGLRLYEQLALLP